MVMSSQYFMSASSFWRSVHILITKFNVVNKRIWGCKTLFSSICKVKNSEWRKPENCTKLSDEGNINAFKEQILNELDVLSLESDTTSNDNLEVIIVELLPKSYTQKKAFQLIILEKNNTAISFYDITPGHYNQNLCPDFNYSIFLRNGVVSLDSSVDKNCKSYQWLQETVLPQFIKWGEEDSNKNKFCNHSLSLISSEKYYVKYNELKLKYGKEMVEVWPEGTDPSKYVYEDVAIATYLLLLWENEDGHPKSKTFVDLGCGNGLLVYILTKEGHQGVGIDVRKRQIWDMYPNDIKLEIKTIIPSDVNLFPEADWLIGNHSDELTPWIPVIAARSSYKCRFFLLPCCAYNFDGSKYQRRDSSKSQYTEYLEYIKEVCEGCGFDTKVDRLKIPSTKRICLVGQKRVYSIEDYQKYCDNIQFLINKDSMTNSKDASNSLSWVSNFKARDSVEKVRNCTQIDKGIIESITCCITNHLLEGCNSKSEWSCGRLVEISKLISLLTKDQIAAMKAECGGLQTLLRNNHHIFKVQNGKVQLRYPKTIEDVNKSSVKNNKSSKISIKVKQKPCWFYNNHPQGCPLTDNTCSYLHLS